MRDEVINAAGPPAVARPPTTELQFLSGGGEAGEIMRTKDWSATELGPLERWPQSLRTSVSTCLNCAFPILIWWGSDLVMLYNDEYGSVIGQKHPSALGRRGEDVFAEIWPTIGPMLNQVLTRGEATRSRDLLLLLNRHGYFEECYFSFSYSPIRDETGGVGGVFCPVIETTDKVLEERRLRTLKELAEVATSQTRRVADVEKLCVAALARNRSDIPFAALYEIGDGLPRFIDAYGIDVESAKDYSPPAQTAAGETVVLDDLAGLAGIDAAPSGESVRSVVAIPIPQRHPTSVLVLGVNPRRRLDNEYRRFFDWVGNGVASAIANARAIEVEHERAEKLAELDRAKTLFFSNVSHEFRTPLTLMMGPLEELIRASALGESDRQRIDVAYRNSLRLLKLVNSLLDFARIEAGRVRAHYEPTDLAAFTAELASNFRSACERAGLRLMVDCPPLPASVHIDRDMWEKIVLNLLSNAFKFTFDGEIALGLRALEGEAEFSVRDSGVGIPESELGHVFERFHRIEGQRSRTFEGSGIGLALVQELVKVHGGTIGVRSDVGHGSTFTVRIPFGTAHLPQEQLNADASAASTPIAADAYVQEALSWLAEAPSLQSSGAAAADIEPSGWPERERILLADDNADMRAYVSRLLEPYCDVVAVEDGQAALEALREQRPDLVLADVMMPRLDGFGLVHAIRNDSRLRDLPVIMLSARAGEESRVEGMQSGADDYLIKPFAARELIARVRANLALSRARREAMTAVRDSENRIRGWFRQAPGLICILRGPDHMFEFVNESYQQFLGNRPLAGRALRDAVPEAEAQGFVALLDDVYRSGQPFSGREMPLDLERVPGGKKSRVYFDFIYQPIFEAGGKVSGIFVEGFDVTERKKHEQQSKLLLDELNHRVKNTLSIVHSIANQTLRNAGAVEQARTAFESRLVALSQAHDVLTRTQWEGADIQELVDRAVSLHSQPGGRRFKAAGPELKLVPKAAVAFSLALHELATNAIKYGALSDDRGSVRIGWSVSDDGPRHRFRLEWEERDGPPVRLPQRKGFGSRLIERGIGQEIGCEVQLRFEPAGLVCIIDAPAMAILAGA